MSGYVRIHRALIDHPAFRNDAESMAFAWMIAKAQWAPKRVRYKERCLFLERGQLAISQRDMARSLDRDKAWVERLWRRLKIEGMIQTSVEAGVAVITICNYSQYQADPLPCEAPGEARDEAGARQGQGTEQEGEEREERKTPRQRGLPIPDGIPEEEYLAFRKMRKGMKVPYTTEAEKGIFDDLLRLKGEGHDLKKVLMKAVKRGWRGVFGDEDTKATAAAKPMSDDEARAWERRYAERGRADEAAEMRRRYPAAFGDVVGKIMKRASVS